MPLSNYDDLYQTCLRHGYFSDTYIVSPVNSRALQGDRSTVCGHYCILFLYLCARLYFDIASSRPLLRQAGHALGALRALVQVTGGDDTDDRDDSVVRVLNELLKRKEYLTPALDCTGLGSAAARRQCCQPHK